MILRRYLATHGGALLARCRREFVRVCYQLPMSTEERILYKLDLAAAHLADLKPDKIKTPSDLQHRADLDCASALYYACGILNLHEAQEELSRRMKH